MLVCVFEFYGGFFESEGIFYYCVYMCCCCEDFFGCVEWYLGDLFVYLDDYVVGLVENDYLLEVEFEIVGVCWVY